MKSLNYIRWVSTEFFFTVSIFSAILFGAYATQIQTNNNLSTNQLTILSGTFFTVFAVSQLVSGFLINKVSSKLLLGFSALLAGCGALLFATTHNYGLLILARAILGTGLGCTFVGVLYIVQSGFAEGKFAFMSSLSQSIANIVAGIMAVFGGKFLGSHSYGHIFTIMGILLIIAAIGMALILPNKPTLAEDKDEQQSLANTLVEIFSKRGFWMAALYFIGLFSTILTFADLFNVKFQVATFGMPGYEAITLNGMIPFGLAMGGVIAGYVSSTLKKNQLTASVFSGLTFITMIIILFAKYPSNEAYLISSIVHILFGIGCGGAMLAFQEVQTTFKKASIRPLANSVILTIAYLFSGMILQPLVGLLIGNVSNNSQANNTNWIKEPIAATAWHEYNHGLIILVIVLLISFISSLFFNKSQKVKSH